MAVVNWPALRKAMAACFVTAGFRYVSRFARETGLNRRTIERVMKEEDPDAEVQMETLVPWLYACGRTDVGAFLQQFVTPPVEMSPESGSAETRTSATLPNPTEPSRADTGQLETMVEKAAHGDRAVSAALYAAFLRDVAVTLFERADDVTATGSITRPQQPDSPPRDQRLGKFGRRRQDFEGMG